MIDAFRGRMSEGQVLSVPADVLEDKYTDGMNAMAAEHLLVLDGGR